MRSVMPVWLEVVLVILAVARLTSLLRVDMVLDKPRQWMFDHLPDHSLLGDLASCAWCISIWVAAGAAVAFGFLHGTWWVDGPALALASSYVTGMLAGGGTWEPEWYPDNKPIQRTVPLPR